MPALVNINVGSLRGTSGEDGTTSWPFLAKKSRKVDLTWLTVVMSVLAWLPAWAQAAMFAGVSASRVF